MKTDAEIQRAVRSELEWDGHIDEREIEVRVDDGVVSLAGSVASWAERVAAAAAAHRVAGVLDVANDIEVKPTGVLSRTDSEIAHALRHSLEWNVFVPKARIRSTVSKGWVTLEGEVDLLSQREDAEHAIRDLAGVAGVVNKIEVKPPTSTTELRQAIDAALRRKADRRAENIALEVTDGRVRVRGIVDSYAEKETVLAAVKGTRGVREIDDALQIAWEAH